MVIKQWLTSNVNLKSKIHPEQNTLTQSYCYCTYSQSLWEYVQYHGWVLTVHHNILFVGQEMVGTN